MAIKMIMSVDKHWGIGYKNRIPWNIKENMNFFKKITYGSCVIMGRRTFKSIGSKPLKNRRNVIVTSKDMSKIKKDNLHFKKYEDVKFKLETISPEDNDIFIIGGKSIYEGFKDFADEIIVTNINGDYETDVKIDPKMLKGFKIDKKEYLSDKANVTYYKRIKAREYIEINGNNIISMCQYGLCVNTTYFPFIKYKRSKKSKKSKKD